MKKKSLMILAWFFLAVGLTGQGTDFSAQTLRYIQHREPILALTNVTVIDGTGNPARSGQTVIIRHGRILDIQDADKISIPDDTPQFDLQGKTLLPGFIMFHEHMFYPAGGGQYNQQLSSFPKLYLAGGVTTIRTAGSMEPYADLNLKKAIQAGRVPGPKMDVTSPYFNGTGLSLIQMKSLKGPDDARKMVAYWDHEGVDSYKVYAQISRELMGVVIEEAHKLGKKVTGHLGAVTYREAAELGIDNLEHGFFVSTDFVPDKEKDKNPNSRAQRESLLKLDPEGAEAASLIQDLVQKRVALTSTLPVFETMTPGRPPAPDDLLDALLPETRDQYLRIWARIANNPDSERTALFEKGMELEKKFFEAGGLLLVGTDPTGYGGVVAGYSNLRAIELLVEEGLSPLEAIQVATLNGARYLGVDDELGTIEAGKIADMVLVDGDPSSDIRDIRKVIMVFKDGIGYDSQKLFDSVRGTVGLR